MQLIKNIRGISFVQVIMASTAIAGLALVGLKLAQGQRELVDRVYADRLSHYLGQEISHLLKKELICRSTFLGKRPRGSRVEALVENIETKKGKVINTYFPIRPSADSKKGNYFDSRVSILAYKLVGNSEVANLKKGITELVVEQEVLGEIIEASFRLKFSRDKEGNIKSCQLFEPGEFSSTGKWEQSSSGIKLIGPRLVIGKKSHSGQKLVSDGEVFISPRSSLPLCNSENEGVLIHEKGGRLLYCKKMEWVPFGEQRFIFENPTSYILSITAVGSDVKFTKKHRICFMNKFKKNSLSDGCQVRRISRGYASEYELKIFTSSDATNSECEVSCVD